MLPEPEFASIMTQAHTATTVTTVSVDSLRQTARPHALPADAAWRVDDVAALFALPFNDLLFRAQQVHREHFDANTVQLSTLLSIRPAAAKRIAATARRARTTTPA